MLMNNKILRTIKTQNGFVIKCTSCGWDSRCDETHLNFAQQQPQFCYYYKKVVDAINKDYVKTKPVIVDDDDEQLQEMVSALSIDSSTYNQERKGVLYKMNKYKDVVSPDKKLLVEYKIKRKKNGTYY